MSTETLDREMADMTECEIEARERTLHRPVINEEALYRAMAETVEWEVEQMEEKVRENRLRRVAKRQGLELHKCPRRDPLAVDYGLYRLARKGAPITHDFTDTLDDVERKLTGHQAT